MRLKDKCFTVPFCVYEDGLPDKALILLIFLFSRSSFGGSVELTYEEIMHGAGILSRNTMAKCIDILRIHGWIESCDQGNKPNRITLQVPQEHEQHIVRKNLKYQKWKANRAKLEAHMRGKKKAIL